MGIIVRQSLANMGITYLAFIVGAVNTLFLYTNFLTPEYYGLTSYILATSNLLWPVIAFGINNTIVKFYSSYLDQKELDKFLMYALLLPLLPALLIGGLGVTFYSFVLTYFEGQNAIIQPYVWTIWAIGFFLAYFEVFYAWAKVHLKSIYGNFIKEFFHRFIISILLVSVFSDVLTQRQFIYAIVAVYAVRMLLMAGYAFYLRRPRLRFALPNNAWNVFKYSVLIVIAGSVSIMLLDLDKVMIEIYFPVANIAFYNMSVYMASIIAVPARAMQQIIHPLTAQLLNDKNYKELQYIYRQSSLHLILVNGIFFVFVLCNAEQLFLLIPDKYPLFSTVLALIAFTKLIEGGMGNANAILYSSDYYRFVLYTGIIAAIVALILNLLLIPRFGLIGAAFATFSALTIYNGIKLFFIRKAFQLQPFTSKTLLALLLIGIFCLSFYSWQFPIHPILGILAKSSLITVLYASMLYVMKLSEPFNTYIDKFFRKRKS